ncbi:MAG: lasso peptide biosynthesis B2 protein [bacterium]
MRIIYFSLTPHTYAAHFDDAIIILDSTSDKYLSFIDSAAQYLQFSLSSAFTHNQDGSFTPIKDKNTCDNEFCDTKFDCDLEQLNYWIAHFIENNFITESAQENRKLIAPLPLQPGGLCDYQWDHKPSWKPFKHASKIQIIKAFFQLARIHRIMKRKGINGILDVIKKTAAHHVNLHQSINHATSLATDQEISKLTAAIDAASLLYPKKTFCLAWASTFVLLALKKNWSCNLAIGVQTNLFYAHAWAQIADTVIHDDPVIAKVLSIILKEPHI